MALSSLANILVRNDQGTNASVVTVGYSGNLFLLSSCYLCLVSFCAHMLYEIGPCRFHK